MENYQDPDYEGNGPKYHTGKKCIEGCGRPAGTAWSPYWCFECNKARMDRISKSLEDLVKEAPNER